MTTPATLLHIGGPTTLMRIGGLSLLTDPTFDPPGEYPMPGGALVKLSGPTRRPDQLGPVDAVLLSHDEHPDNLDRSGREFLSTVPRVFSTAAAARRLDGVDGLVPWSTCELSRPDGTVLTVTAVPARHGPPGSESVIGDVTGFVVSGDDVPTVYFSGDNASLDLVADLADRIGPIDVVVLCVGAPKLPRVAGDQVLGLGARGAVVVARLLERAAVVPVHT